MKEVILKDNRILRCVHCMNPTYLGVELCCGMCKYGSKTRSFLDHSVFCKMVIKLTLSFDIAICASKQAPPSHKSVSFIHMYRFLRAAHRYTMNVPVITVSVTIHK